ncbi:MAG: type II toxin-antitoxin system HicB family antitoxin [Alphaproteobacteria bacterium]|nr:type II toxin-antitoxin system HicB family antitoxin [Alphaproteobacteria bacterium]MDA8029904.1 type II toxin-antitoxin system HicB family antitoxin [Alphaproteobacteria bacterium]
MARKRGFRQEAQMAPQTTQMKFDAVIAENKKEGEFYALIKELPSCTAYGYSLKEVMKNIRDVAQAAYDDAKKNGFGVGTHDGEEYFRKTGLKIIKTVPILVK